MLDNNLVSYHVYVLIIITYNYINNTIVDWYIYSKYNNYNDCIYQMIMYL